MIYVLLGTNHELATSIQAAFDHGWVEYELVDATRSIQKVRIRPGV